MRAEEKPMTPSDPVEAKLLQDLKIANSKLQALVAQATTFLADNPDKEFKDPAYFKKQEELTTEIDGLIQNLIANHAERNKV
jgi:hypothetical protein